MSDANDAEPSSGNTMNRGSGARAKRICLLPNCNVPIPQERLSKGGKYCSIDHKRDHENLRKRDATAGRIDTLATTRRCRSKLCIERFVPVNASHWFHEPACSLTPEDMKWTVEDILAEEGSLLPGGSHLEMAKAAFGQKNTALRENTRLRSLREYLTYEVQAFHDEHPEYLHPAIPAPPKSSGKKSPREIIVQTSDWQIGKWEQGFGWEATKKRVESLKQATAGIIQRQRDAGFPVRTVRVSEGGDGLEGCLPAGTPVFTEDGPVPIEQVLPGQRVWSSTDSGLALRAVTDAAQTGVKPVIRIETTERTIEATAEHPVLVRRLTRSAGKGAGSGTPFTVSHEYVPAGDLVEGDIIVGLDTIDGGGDESPTRPATVEMMEFLGFFIGDGNLTYASGRPNGVYLSHGKNEPYMEHYREISASLFAKANGAPLHVADAEWGTRFASTTAGDEIVRLGFTGNAHSKRVPGWVFRLSRELRLAFIRGYLDADGHVNKLGQMVFASVNRGLAEDIRHLCMSVGLVVSPLRHQDRVAPLPQGGTQESRIWIVFCGAPDLNAEVGSWTPWYVERWGARAGARRKRSYKVGGKATRRETTPPDGGRYLRVLRIERSLIAQPVYNITVEGDHNYIAEGVFVHNCYIYRGQNVTGLDKSSNTHRLTQQIRLLAHARADFATFLSTLVDEVIEETVGGNHGRPNGPNDYADPEDNFDVMAAWWASDITRENKRIKWNTSENWWHSFESMGHQIVSIHGDQWQGPLERLETLLPQWIATGVFGKRPEMVLTHHRHSRRELEVAGIPVVQNGTIDGGSGWYLRQYGRASRPAQNILVVSQNHLYESLFPVWFSDRPSGALVA